MPRAKKSTGSKKTGGPRVEYGETRIQISLDRSELTTIKQGAAAAGVGVGAFLARAGVRWAMATMDAARGEGFYRSLIGWILHARAPGEDHFCPAVKPQPNGWRMGHDITIATGRCKWCKKNVGVEALGAHLPGLADA